MIFGGPGSGKSTLARAVGARLGLPVVHMDHLYWAPNWVERPPETVRRMALERIAEDAWVFDGNHSSTFDARAERSDLIVYLDVPRHVRIARILRRTALSHGRVRPDMGPGCPEQFDPSFVFGFTWRYAGAPRDRALAFLDRWRGRRPICILGRGATVTHFLTSLPSA